MGINKFKVVYVIVVRFFGEVGFFVDIEGGGYGKGFFIFVIDIGFFISVESNMFYVYMFLFYKFVIIFIFVYFEFDVF